MKHFNLKQNNLRMKKIELKKKKNERSFCQDVSHIMIDE